MTTLHHDYPEYAEPPTHPDVRSLIRLSRELFPCVIGINDDSVRQTRKAWVRARLHLERAGIQPRVPIATQVAQRSRRVGFTGHRPVPRWHDPDLHVGVGLALLAVFMIVLVLTGQVQS